MCSGTTKMTQEKKQISYDSGATWVDVIPSETRPALPVIEYESEDCGYVPPTPTQYRWTQSGTTCIGYDKYQNNIKEQSTDGGTTWSDVSPQQTQDVVIEYSSSQCQSPSVDKKWTATYIGGSTSSANCDSTSAITQNEINITNLASVNIGNCVNTIGNFTFSGCTTLSSVTIPNSVTSIGNMAFKNCENISSVTIPNSVTSIGWSAFSDCSGLTTANIPSGLTDINDLVFFNCRNLSAITIPNGITSIGRSAFEACFALSSVTIPNSVISIANRAFGVCVNIESVSLGSGITSIGDEAFSDCIGLTSITVNATTPPTIGNNVFDNTNDCDIIVPCASETAYKTAWAEYANRITCQITPPTPTFEGKWLATYTGGTTSSAQCDSTSAITENEINLTDLVSVEIGDCVTEIGDNALSGCTTLESVTIPDSVTYIGFYAFDSCSGLTSVELGSGVTTIAAFSFYFCFNLRSITIPNSVTLIGSGAFWGCTGLTSVSIGSGITEIAGNAFYYCSSLSTVTCLATTPPTLGTNAFSNTNNCPIYVPSESLNAYKSAWSDYASRIQAIS